MRKTVLLDTDNLERFHHTFDRAAHEIMKDMAEKGTRQVLVNAKIILQVKEREEKGKNGDTVYLGNYISPFVKMEIEEKRQGE